MKTKKQNLSSTQKMSQGAGWLSIASVSSRVMGVFYIIPWLAMFGSQANEANGLFNIGYQYYSLFLIIATAGIPSAISKEMAFYTARNEFKTALKLFKVAFSLMSILGLIAGSLLWVLAPIFAKSSPVNHPEDATAVIRSLVPALITLPFLSIIRGFFESFQDMKPSALSQMVEQFVRVFFILVATYVSIQLLNKDLVFAVSISTFAAFIGSLGALLLLAFYYFKYRQSYINLRMISRENHINIPSILKKVIWTALPFVITSSGTTLMQLIDTNTFKPIMLAFSSLDTLEITNHYAIFSGNVNKLIMIVISFSVAIGQTQVPVLSEAYSTGNRDTQHGIIHSSMQLFMTLMLPSVLGMYIVAEPLYTIFYGADPLGTSYLKASMPMTFVLGLYFVLYTALQALNMQKKAINGLFIGIILKLILQIPLLAFFGTKGALFATTITFIGINGWYILILRKENFFSFRSYLYDSKYVIWNTVFMSFGAIITFKLFSHYLLLGSRFTSIFAVIVVGFVGGFIYFFLGLKNGVIESVIGQSVLFKKRKL